MASLDAVEALYFTLVSGAAWAEGIVLSEDLPIDPASVFRDLGADFLGALAQFFFHLLREPRDRLRLIEFDNDALDSVEARADPARRSRAAVPVQRMLDRVSRIFGRVSDRRAADEVDLAGGACAGGCRTSLQLPLTNAREVRHCVSR
jgi:hypothetical protein